MVVFLVGYGVHQIEETKDDFRSGDVGSKTRSGAGI